MKNRFSVLLIGAGNMGGALLKAWSSAGILNIPASAVLDPVPADSVIEICEERRIRLNPMSDEDGYDICVLAVKPQMFPDVLPGLHWPNIDRTLFVSIAAGVTIDTITSLLKSSTPNPAIIRGMPNLASAFTLGTTLLTDDGRLSEEERRRADMLFCGAGSTVWCDDEDGLDKLMGVSGCGPAYLYLLAEALEDAAIKNGASAEDARMMAEMTLIGAAQQLSKDGRSAADLRHAVMSKGGTTAEAVAVLDNPEHGFRPLVQKAVDAAYTRAKELAS